MFITFTEPYEAQVGIAPTARGSPREKERRQRPLVVGGTEMSILLGILLYVLCIAWFCGLTGFNRLDDSEPQARRARENALLRATAPADRVPARRRMADARE